MAKLTYEEIKVKVLAWDVEWLTPWNVWTTICWICEELLASTWTKRNAEETHIIQSTLWAVDIHNNWAVVQFTWDVRSDAWWNRTNNQFTYTGSPDHVRWKIEINAEDVWASNFWSRPKIRILKWWNVIAVIDDLVMQITGAYDWDATVNWTFLDVDPWVNPVYTWEWFDKDNRTATLEPTPISNICMEAVEKFQVLSV